ncbi:serine/arginine repetitive matrix protein 2-like [Tyto alba]|uniref:serine/arginine repetitive matrix protein 2-like n=1 Tax=Tyto alba TaxID=56313 RepID=UPI001C67B505|nr:serine/arginine repetitive matrix protein 2-like [Tyto alba]
MGTQMMNKMRGTAAAMPVSAFAQEAGSTQSDRGPGNCSCAAPALPRAPTDDAPTWGPAQPDGSATAVLAWAPVRGKAPGCPRARPGSGCPFWAWQSPSAPGGLGAQFWPLLPRAWGAVPVTFLLPLTASSGSSEVAGPITESQSGSGPSHSSPAPETSSPSSTGLQAASGPSQSSPVPESSSCSSPPGPDRVRDRARSRRSAQKPYSRPTRHRGRSSAPARRAERSTPGQLARGRSHSSLVPESSSPSTSTTAASGSSSSFTELESSSPSSTGGQGASGPSQSSSPPPESSSCSSPPGPDRVRDRSRSRRRAQKPYSRRTRGRGRSRAPAPRAESSSPAQSVPGCSRGSPVPETGSPSTPSSARLQSSRRPSRPGPVRGRDRSRLRRRAQNPYSRPGR